MQTPEERIDALCDNVENILKNSYDTQYITPANINTFSSVFHIFTNAGDLKDEFIRKFASRCGYEPRGK